MPSTVRLPRALRTIVSASYIPQAVVCERNDSREAIESSRLSADGRLLQIFIVQTALTIVVLLTGPLVAILVLVAMPSRPVELINYVSSLIFAITYPLSAIGMTLLYFDHRPVLGTRIDRTA